MPVVQSLTAEKSSYVPPVTPELDERLWRAWKEKNRTRDRFRAKRRQRVMLMLLLIVAVAVILWRAMAV